MQPSLQLLHSERGPRRHPTDVQQRDDLTGQIWTPQAVPAAQADRFVNNYSNLCLVARGTAESQLLQSTCGNWADQYWK